MRAIDFVLVVGGAPLFAFVMFKAAASGWYSVKFHYQRRFVDGITRGDPNG